MFHQATLTLFALISKGPACLVGTQQGLLYVGDLLLNQSYGVRPASFKLHSSNQFLLVNSPIGRSGVLIWLPFNPSVRGHLDRVVERGTAIFWVCKTMFDFTMGTQNEGRSMAIHGYCLSADDVRRGDMIVGAEQKVQR